MATRQTILVRLGADEKARIKAAAAAQGLSVNEWILQSCRDSMEFLPTSDITKDLKLDSTLQSGEISGVKAELAVLSGRVEKIEQQLQSPPLPQRRENAQTTAPPAPATPPAPGGGEGIAQGIALISAGYQGNPANASRDLKAQGSSPAAWLEARGWVQSGRRWLPPADKQPADKRP